MNCLTVVERHAKNPLIAVPHNVTLDDGVEGH